MCSNRCANPVRPSRSFADPTWYQRFTATIGAVRSGESVTSKPLSSREVWIGIAAGGADIDRSGCTNSEGKPDRSDRVEKVATTQIVRIWREVLLQLAKHAQIRPDRAKLAKRALAQSQINSRNDYKIPAVVPNASACSCSGCVCDQERYLHRQPA